MRSNETIRRVHFYMDVFRFYVLVFLVFFMIWLTQIGTIQPIGSLFSIL